MTSFLGCHIKEKSETSWNGGTVVLGVQALRVVGACNGSWQLLGCRVTVSSERPTLEELPRPCARINEALDSNIEDYHTTTAACARLHSHVEHEETSHQVMSMIGYAGNTMRGRSDGRLSSSEAISLVTIPVQTRRSRNKDYRRSPVPVHVPSPVGLGAAEGTNTLHLRGGMGVVRTTHRRALATDHEHECWRRGRTSERELLEQWRRPPNRSPPLERCPC